MLSGEQSLQLLSDVIERACRAGADSADAVYVESVSLSHGERMGELEGLSRSEGADLGLRVLSGKRQAIASTSDTSTGAITELVERVTAMVAFVPEDPHAGLADEDALATAFADLDEFDSTEPGNDELRDRAKAAEDAARSVAGVTNSEGAEASWGNGLVGLATSRGFAQYRRRSSHSVSASVLAGEGTAMERDYDYATSVHGADLTDPAEIGRMAGEKAVERLNPRKVETSQVPVIYDPRVASSLLGHLAGAVNGASVARGTTFLKDKMGEALFDAGVSVVDDPLRVRGLRSKTFDGEGIPTQRRDIIRDGVLQTWILDLRTARQLGLATTGHAARGTSSPPSPSVTNLYMEAGTRTPEDLIKDAGNGFYVTELIGMGVNGVTGDYSRGASGFWIEDGALSYPVSEVTIAGNLLEMFRQLTPADDLEFRYGTNAPTVRVDGMTVAGK